MWRHSTHSTIVAHYATSRISLVVRHPCFRSVSAFIIDLLLIRKILTDLFTHPVKVFDGILAGVVPVYYGAPTVKNVLPGPNPGVVEVSDFASPKELAEFLMAIGKDQAKYEAYLGWKINKSQVCRSAVLFQALPSPFLLPCPPLFPRSSRPLSPHTHPLSPVRNLETLKPRTQADVDKFQNVIDMTGYKYTSLCRICEQLAVDIPE